MIPMRELELLRWYYTYALPKIEGESTHGSIEYQLSMYAPWLAQQHVADNPRYYSDDYNVYPAGAPTAVVTAEYRNVTDRVPQAGVAHDGHFRFVTSALSLVVARDRLSLHVLEEYSTYGDAWGSLGAPQRMGALFWMTEAGKEILDAVERERAANGWANYGGHPRKCIQSSRARERVDRRAAALSNQAEMMFSAAWAAWSVATNEVRAKVRAA